MGLFFRGKEGGILDVIRCDERDYLIWKWRPNGGTIPTKKENSIRWGSQIRVREGSVAVFAYDTHSSWEYDYVEGPCDKMLSTANLPVLTGLLGLLYNKDTPFQAEVYFINTQGLTQIRFGVPFFDIYDETSPEFGVPVAVRGTLNFSIKDYRQFIKLHSLYQFELNDFTNQVRSSIIQFVKSEVANVPYEQHIPVLQIERKIDVIGERLRLRLKEHIEQEFAVSVSDAKISDIEIDKTSSEYQAYLKKAQAVSLARTDAEVQMQQVNLDNAAEQLRIQREAFEFSQRMQTASQNLAAYQIEKQTEVGIAGAEALGQMANNGATNIEGGNMNPVGIMTGMTMASLMSQNIVGAMNNVNSQPSVAPMQNMTPPPVPQELYHIVIDGKAAGPYNKEYFSQLKQNGQFDRNSLVWKKGLKEWVKASTLEDLQSLFDDELPPIPPLQ